MRQLLWMTLLLIGGGCHGVGERLHGRHACAPAEPCAPVEKRGAPAPEKPREAPPPRQDVGEAARAAIAQDVLLVPRMVYMPYVAQIPTGPMRMAPHQLPPGPEPVGAPRGEPRPPAGEPGPELRKAVELCEKLHERITQLEKSLQERQAAPAPAPVCPPQPLFPLFRRPLFHRADAFFPRCDPQCDPWQPCEQVPNQPTAPQSKPLPKGPVLSGN
jgi:hypothetical protein